MRITRRHSAPLTTFTLALTDGTTHTANFRYAG